MTHIPNNILDLLEELFYHNIFPYLSYNDILRLRRVCSKTKLYADNYIRTNFTNQEREINEVDHTFINFIYRNLPTSKIYLSNTSPEFFEHPGTTQFLQFYARQITHLRVNNFSTCITQSENKFYTALENLQHLEIYFTDASQRECTSIFNEFDGQKVPCNLPYFPPNFVNLKTLKLHRMQTVSKYEQCYYFDLVNFCTNLEYLKHPSFVEFMPGMSCRERGPFDVVTKLIEKSLTENPDEPVRIKKFDMEHYKEQGLTSFDFMQLIEKCYQNNVKLENVDAAMFQLVREELREQFETIVTPIVSLQNVHGSLFMDELPNLEKVVITSVKKSVFGNFWIDNQPEWPNLKELELYIDSYSSQTTDEFESLLVQDLFDLLFDTLNRPSLTNLKIRFDPGQSTFVLPCPSVQDICSTCAFLTKLTLENWLDTNKAVSRFWSELPLLEELTVDTCENLGNDEFVGRNKDEPIFLKLKCLKKLSLLGLDQMPKITDKVFNLVFRHLKIKEFYLTSTEPIKSVTADGIRELLTGPFNTSVDKFPFRNWSLVNVSDEEFHSLNTEFRAHYMI